MNRKPVIRNYDNYYNFRSDSNFVYLTGFYEENSAMLLWREANKKGVKTHYKLFCQNRDPLKELWTGKLTGPERATKTFGADEAHDFSELNQHIQSFYKKLPKGVGPSLFTNSLESDEMKSQFEPILESLDYNIRQWQLPLESIVNASTPTRKLRLVKDRGEISLMKKVSKINVAAHLELLKKIKAGMTEFQAQALIEYEFRKRGASGPAYGSICASGANATCLHYQPSMDKLKKGELFLVDAGCEMDHYTSDITRTYPVDGKFTKAQKSIHQIVGEAHRAAIEVATVGTRYSKIHETAVEAIAEGLRLIKLLKGNKKDIIAKEKYKQFFPHSTGHWLGMDVHDPCPYSEENGDSIKLKAGMILTVEPGIYIQEYDKTVPKNFKGIGVRIEDDILITEKGPEIITEGLPRYAEETEAFMK